MKSNNNNSGKPTPTPTPKIMPLTNGPYYLINDMEPKVVENLQNSKGQPLSTIRGVALCRCGASNTKPFCDGTHGIIRWSSENRVDDVSNSDAASPEAIIETIRKCPSGALSYSINGIEYRDPPDNRRPMVTVSKGGPYAITGGVELIGNGIPFGEGASKEHYTLCRCGASNNKPFCDGMHGVIKFKD